MNLIEFAIGVIILLLIWIYLDLTRNVWFDYPDEDYLADDEDDDL